MTKKNLLRILLSLSFVLMGFSAGAQGKAVSIEAVDMDLPSAINNVERQSDYYKFNYNVRKLKQFKVTASIKNRPALEAVKTLISGLPLSMSTSGRYVDIKMTEGGDASASVSDKTSGISGVVTDEEGEPLTGVVVIGEDNKLCAITDLDGAFHIATKADKMKLTFNYVGMKEADATAINGVPLKMVMTASHTMLSEVVVTGYQEIKKEKLTGSVTTVSSAKLDERYTTNLLDNLEGRVAGLSTYGGKPVIRGVGTLRGSTQPLLVVDGMPIEGSIENINPYDIESVNVLKDAAAAAIYGARAANGIIVITTKTAKNNGKIDIDFSANVTWFENANVDYADNFYMTPEQQIKAESDYYEYYFFNNDGEVRNPIQTAESEVIQGNQVTPLKYAYLQLAKGEISRPQLENTINQLKENNYARDFAREMYHRQVIQQYNMVIRQRSDKARNNFVVNYKKDNEQLRGHKNDWLNIRYKGSYDLVKWLTATVSIDGVYANRHGYNDANSNATNIWAYTSYMPFYADDGSLLRQYPYQTGNHWWTPEKGCFDLGVDPVKELEDNRTKTRTQNMRYHGSLLFKIIPGLTATTQFVYEIGNEQMQTIANSESLAARIVRNAYAYVENGEVKYQTPDGGLLSSRNINTNSWTARGQLNYSKTFLDKHDIAVIAGLEFRETLRKGTNGLLVGYDDQLQTAATESVDFGTLHKMTRAPYFMTTGGSTYGFSTSTAFAYFRNYLRPIQEERHRYASGYFNATYTYDGRYNLFGSFRKDYADVYGLNSKFRGKPLWSVGVGWNIHNENFIHDLTWINFLKLRFSYGVTGNIYQGATSFMTASTDDNNTFTKLPYATITSPANPQLRWEQNKTTNIGLDFNLMNYRLRGSVDFYNKVGNDIFHTTNLDATGGFSSMVANVASIKNRGVELALSYDWFRPHGKNDFRWTTNMTLTFNKNEVTDVENSSTSAMFMIYTPYKKGYPVNAMWSYRFAGISDEEGSKGQVLYYVDDNGKTSHNATGASPDCLEFSGQKDPKTIIAMDNNLWWKGFSLGLTMVYYGGHKMYALPEVETYDEFNYPLASYFLNAWTPENPTNTPGIGRYATTQMGSEPRNANNAVHDAAFIKIRNIVFGYDLPSTFLRRFGINNCRLRFQINNPKAIWTANNVGVDPETGGIRQRASYMAGLNINL